METASSQEKPEISIKEELKPGRQRASVLEILGSLKSAQEDIGQIIELSSEEETLVAEFFKSLSIAMDSLAQTIPVSAEKLSKSLGDVAQATVDKSGYLVLLYRNGKIELKNLREERHRNLMVTVLEDALPQFKQLFSDQLQKTEERMNFFSTITKEMQRISVALSNPDT